MTTWATRARAHFQKTAQPPADETDKKGVSSVLAVPSPLVFEKTTPLDDRSTCPACTHYHRARKQCLNHRRAGLNEPSTAAAIAHLPQRCPGFAALIHTTNR